MATDLKNKGLARSLTRFQNPTTPTQAPALAPVNTWPVKPWALFLLIGGATGRSSQQYGKCPGKTEHAESEQDAGEVCRPGSILGGDRDLVARGQGHVAGSTSRLGALSLDLRIGPV